MLQLRSLTDAFGEGINPGRKQPENKLMSIKDARPLIEKAEQEKLTESPTVSLCVLILLLLRQDSWTRQQIQNVEHEPSAATFETYRVCGQLNSS